MIANGAWGTSLANLSILQSFTTGRYQWSTYRVTITVLSFLMMMVLLRRLIADRQEKQRLASEFEAARVVQQLLLTPSSHPASEYRVEAIYEPAQEWAATSIGLA